jgi:Mrp family chromosome partitioning ATPase
MMVTSVLLKIPRLFAGAQRFTMPPGFRRDCVLREEDFAAQAQVGAKNPVQGVIEHLRGLYLGLVEQLGEDGAVAICSPCPREGRSLIVANLAITMAHDTEHPVTVIDLAFAGSKQAPLLDVERGPGFGDFSPGDHVSSIVTPTKHEGLELIHPGYVGANGTRALQSGALEDILAQLKAQGRFVIIDTPAVSVGVDARVVAERVDGVVTVVRLGKTKRSDLAPYYRAFRDLPLLGVACNDHERWLPGWLQRFL